MNIDNLTTGVYKLIGTDCRRWLVTIQKPITLGNYLNAGRYVKVEGFLQVRWSSWWPKTASVTGCSHIS